MSDLRERIQEKVVKRRALAKAATPGPWTVELVVYGPPDEGYGEPSQAEVRGPRNEWVVSHMYHEGGGSSVEDAEHIAHNDPSRILRDCLLADKILASIENCSHRLMVTGRSRPLRAGGWCLDCEALLRDLAEAWGVER